MSSRPTLDYEQRLWQTGIHLVAGVDEAGRGALAGPVVAGAVVLPASPGIALALQGVADSKQLTARQRDEMYALVTTCAAGWAAGMATAAEIDESGIVPATRLAMMRAVAGLNCQPQHLLIDYVRLPALAIAQQAITHGDSLVLSIAAASIVAKVTRDRWMIEAGQRFPGYEFECHKGYATEVHLRQLRQLGPCRIHRTSFEPVRGWQMALFPADEETARSRP